MVVDFTNLDLSQGTFQKHKFGAEFLAGTINPPLTIWGIILYLNCAYGEF